MDQAVLVYHVHGPGQRFHQFGRPANGLRLAIDLVRQAGAVNEFQGEIRQIVLFADIIDLHDMRMLQPGNGFGFRVETGSFALARKAPCQDHLQGNQAFQTKMACLVHHAHGAPPHFVQDFVAGHRR